MTARWAVRAATWSHAGDPNPSQSCVTVPLGEPDFFSEIRSFGTSEVASLVKLLRSEKFFKTEGLLFSDDICHLSRRI